MSTLLSVLGFAVQLYVIASFGAIVISSVFLRSTDSALIGEDHPSGAVVAVDSDGVDATLLCASSYTYEDDGCLGVSCLVTFEPSSDDLSFSTVKELRALARERGIKGVSSLRKHELLLAIQDSYLFT